MLSRILLSVFSFILTTASLLAQASPEPVKSPQRGATYAGESGGWYTEPLIWIGLIAVILVVILLVLRGKNRPTHNKLHKY